LEAESAANPDAAEDGRECYWCSNFEISSVNTEEGSFTCPPGSVSAEDKNSACCVASRN
jgi:hypothetical protein